jgi:UDP-N-acetylmuramyl pentapeptide phosphotransferase/UDP-N-acetylglucosamine-1-phosphate transferase
LAFHAHLDSGITNAVNLSDGLDGLAAGISAIACGVIAILATYNGDVVMAILMLAMLGSLTGFVLFNFQPAKIFMGDSGSLFWGFTIASASVLAATKTETIVGPALPTLALGIPILDTLFSRLRGTITGLKRKYAITNPKKQELETFENIELHFRQAKKFDEWWHAVCFAADEMDFVSSCLLTTDRDGTKRPLVWEKGNGNIPANEISSMIVPVVIVVLIRR